MEPYYKSGLFVSFQFWSHNPLCLCKEEGLFLSFALKVKIEFGIGCSTLDQSQFLTIAMYFYLSFYTGTMKLKDEQGQL